MDCAELRATLSDYLDDQLEPTHVLVVHAHLRRCTDCTTELTRLLATVRALRCLPRPEPTTDPWAAIAFQLRREGLLRPRYAVLRPWGVGAAVAGVAIVVLSWQVMHPAPAPASLEAYWREHAVFSAQGEPTMGEPAVEAMEATYQLQGVQP